MRARAKGPKGRSLSRFPQHEACLEVLLLPSGRDASPSLGYPPAVCRRYPFIHLAEDKVDNDVQLSKETTRRARLEPRSSRC